MIRSVPTSDRDATQDDSQPRAGWIYASLTVIDGQRRLRPTHVSFDHLRFSEPPILENTRIEVIVQNGDEEHRQFVDVLPHEPQDTRIPVKLIGTT
jgi:hypothetical protein